MHFVKCLHHDAWWLSQGLAIVHLLISYYIQPK